MFWRERIRAVGVSMFSMAICQQTVISSASAARKTRTESSPMWFCNFSMRRS